VVKVFKSVGAVRVYNPMNAVGAVIGVVLLVAGIGFAIGWIANNGDNGSSASSSAVSDASGRQAAYQQGLTAGRTQGAAAAKKATPAPAPAKTRTIVKGNYGNGFKAGSTYVLGDIKSSGAYFVQLGQGTSGLRVGPHVSAKTGFTYWLCGGGKRICYAPGGAPTK
jgi:hypothetical protein